MAGIVGQAGTGGIAGTASPTASRQDPLSAPPRRGIELVDEPLGSPGSTEFSPSGGGSEASTSSTTMEELETYEAPRHETALADEIAVETQHSNCEVLISMAGSQWGPFTGPIDVDLQFNGAKLPYGGSIRCLFRSTNGNSVTATATISIREV